MKSESINPMISKAAVFVTVIMSCIFLLMTEHVFAEENLYEYDNYRYRVSGNEVTIVDYGYNLSDEELMKIDFSGTIVIPSTIDGMKVVAVEKGAFEPTIGYSYTCKDVRVSDYMTNVDLNSFNALGSLRKITLGRYTKRFLSYGKYRGTILELSKIAVPKGAKYLKVSRNGGLYSKDGKVLYAVPQKKKGSFSVASETKTIYRYAFCLSSLRTIRFPKSIRKIYSSAFKGYDVNCRKTLKVPSSKVKKYKNALKASGTGLYRTKIIKY